MRDSDKKNSNLILTFTILALLALLVIGILSLIYFTTKNNTNALPRLTFDLYEDLDAFMQYDY